MGKYMLRVIELESQTITISAQEMETQNHCIPTSIMELNILDVGES